MQNYYVSPLKKPNRLSKSWRDPSLGQPSRKVTSNNEVESFVGSELKNQIQIDLHPRNFNIQYLENIGIRTIFLGNCGCL